MTLDERIASDPLLHAELVLYVYYQYNEELTASEVKSAVDSLLSGEGAGLKEGTLGQAMHSSLTGSQAAGSALSAEQLQDALRKMKANLEAAERESHDFLSDLVIRDYAAFEPYLLGAYNQFMNRTSSLASVHNYLDAEMEMYRAASFCFPGMRKHSEEIFSRLYRKPAAAGSGDHEGVRRVEFLQWLVTQYVIPAVEMIVSEWYYSRFRRSLNQRVLPIFRDVVQQRRSVFLVTGRSKNNVVLEDLLYAEGFNVKMTDAGALEKGNVVECTLIRHASSSRINSIVRLIAPEEAQSVISDISSRRRLMMRMHDGFVSRYGGEALILQNPMEAISRYNEFTASFSDANGLKDMPIPRLVNAEAFNAYPGFRAALLCETNNFYLSIYYPMLLEAIDGRMNPGPAGEIADICLGNAIAMPFTSLKRIIAEHGGRMVGLASRLHPEVRDADGLKKLVMRERGHSWDYLPLPLVAGGRVPGQNEAGKAE